MKIDELKDITKNVAQELKDAEGGAKTSLPFIRHELASSPLVDTRELFQVLVIGGSMYKSSFLKRRTKGNISTEKKEEGRQPVFTSKDVFLNFILDHIDPSVSVVGINFAFPLMPFFRDGRLDGRLSFGTKEHSFEGLIGKVIGAEIEAYVFKHRQQTIQVSIANDTICLLLAGLTKYDKEELAAGIVGTGINFAIFLPDGSAVNLEAANFDKFTVSDAVRAVDATSNAPGSALAEKEIAGAYLYQIFNEEMRQKGEDFDPIVATDQMDVLAKKNGTASGVSQQLLERSAQLTACIVAGITELYGRDMVFNMEGSLFWKGWKYTQTVEKSVHDISPERKISFGYIPDSGILGAAKLVA